MDKLIAIAVAIISVILLWLLCKAEYTLNELERENKELFNTVTSQIWQ